MHAIDSDKVLGKRGCSTLLVDGSERTRNGHPAGALNRKASYTQRSLEMKQLLSAITLVVAFAAPAMAESFSNPYATTLGR